MAAVRRCRTVWPILALWGLAPAVASTAAGQETTIEGSAAVPFRASEWQVRAGKWRFEAKGELVCEGSVRSSLLYLRRFSARDVEISVEVKFLGPESSAGIFFRAAGERFYEDTSFYQLEWYTRGHHHDRRLSLMTKNPRWKQIVTPIIREAPIGKWITFRVRAVGDHLEAFIDDERVFDQRDRTFPRPGRLGLHVFQPQEVRFRNVRVSRL